MFEKSFQISLKQNIIWNIATKSNHYFIVIPYFYIIFQSDDAINSERMYDLIAVVVHCGSGPNRGHYISIVKSHGFWLLFDDDIVDVSAFMSVYFCLI